MVPSHNEFCLTQVAVHRSSLNKFYPNAPLPPRSRETEGFTPSKGLCHLSLSLTPRPQSSTPVARAYGIAPPPKGGSGRSFLVSGQPLPHYLRRRYAGLVYLVFYLSCEKNNVCTIYLPCCSANINKSIIFSYCY